MALQVIRSARANYSLETYVGDKGQIFYREELGDFRLSDGRTPGGIELLSAGFKASFVDSLTELVAGNIEAGDFLVVYDDSTNSLKKIRFDNLLDLSSVNESIIPASDKNFDLGSATNRWNDIYARTLYLDTNTIFLGSDTLTLDDQGNLLVNGQPVIERVRFFVAGDDSNVRTINANETVKFIGSNGITTATDDEGNVTIIGSLQDLTPYATTVYVDQEISALLSSAPETLDTLKELADALGNDADFSTSILTALSNKLDKTDQYKFKVAGDDSSVVEINNRETVKFVGGVGISTSTDPEGNITFNGFSGDWNDLLDVPNFSVVSSTGSYLDLLDKPYIPLDYVWRIAGDDSVQRTVSNGETVRFIGTNGVSTNTDDEGNVTITGTISDLSPYATTMYVDNQISELINGAPDLLNTLSELAQALNGDENFAGNVITILDNKLDKSQQYRFSISADDSVLQQIDKDESVKFIGGVGISTLSDGEGNITINGFSGSYQDLDNTPDINQEVTTLLTTGFVGDIIPSEDGVYDLGSETRAWRDLWIGGSTIRIGKNGQTIRAVTSENGEKFISFTNSDGLEVAGQIIRVINNVMYLPPNVTVGGEPLSTFSGDYEDLTNKPDVPTDISDLTDEQGRLAAGYSFSIAADDSTQRPISNNETVKISGTNGVTTSSDDEGNITISGPNLSNVASSGDYDDLSNKPAIPSDINDLTDTNSLLFSGDYQDLSNTPTIPQNLNDLADVDINATSLGIGKVLKYNGQSWVAAAEAGSVEAGSGSGDAATLNGFDGTHYLNYNNLTNTPDPYELPPATADTLGGVRIGENINVNNGTISVPKGAGINKVVDIPDVVDDELADGAILAYNGGADRWETRGLDLTNSIMDGGFY
jgi:hypothetical protein